MARGLDKFVNLHVEGIEYSLTRLVILGIGLAVGAGLWLWLNRTRMGMVIRAGVDDRAMVSALGVNIQLVFAVAFIVGSALAGFGGGDRRLLRQPRAGSGRQLAAQLAGGRDHRRDGSMGARRSARCCSAW